MKRCIRVAFVLTMSAVSPRVNAADKVDASSTNNDVRQLFTRGQTDADGGVRLRVDADTLSLAASSLGLQRVEMPLPDDETIVLLLERFKVTTAETRFIRASNGGQVITSAPNVLLLRGQIEGEHGSSAFLALTERGAGTGSIIRAGGRQYHLAVALTDGRPDGLIMREGSGAAPDFEDFCRIVESPHPVDGGIAGGDIEPARGVRVLTVAIEGDQKYTQLFPDELAAQEYIVQVIGPVTDIYMRDLRFKLVLDSVRLWPDGGEPFGADNIFGFQDYWINNEDHTGLNLVHLFSGRRDLEYGGIAFLADGCSEFAFGISGFLLGGFPSPVDGPDLGNWDLIVVAHEMGHNLGTVHSHDYLPPIDMCTSGVEQRGCIMSYCHTNPGGVLNTDMRFHVRIQDFIAGNNPPDNCLFHDCNGNNINDEDDISGELSADANGNLIPDECEDCNSNGVRDDLEIAVGGAFDVNKNGLPDTCEADCNGNLLPDMYEITLGNEKDENGNRIPDSCEPDCDANNVPDFLDILDDTHDDLDRNTVPDICQDCNANGQSDWIDMERQLNMYIGQDFASLREYHAASGVNITDYGLHVNRVYDLVFGEDRQLYVASFADNRIVRINVDAASSTNFVSPGSGGLLRPSGLTFGPDGDLYVASKGNSRILKYNGQTGASLGTFVAPGTGTLTGPLDLAFGPNGNLFVISGNDTVLEFNGVTGEFVRPFISGLGGPADEIHTFTFLPNGDLIITSRSNDTVNRYDPDGNLIGPFNDEYPIDGPWGVTVGPNGNVYIARMLDPIRIIEYDADTGRYIRAFVRGDEALLAPTSFAFRPPSPNDLNGNQVPDVCEAGPCTADIAPINTGGNNAVDVDDLFTLIAAWGPCEGCPADLDASGDVDVDDLFEVLDQWGPCLPD